MRARACLVAVALPLLATLACGSTSGSSPPPTPDAGPDPDTFALSPKSCAYTCPSSSCAESTTPYACQNLGAWSSIPHADTCPAWDGKSPAVTQGQCTATTPSGDAIVTAQKNGSPVVLPDGRRVRPAGRDWLFAEADVPQALPVSAIAVPGTSLVIVVDEAYGLSNALRVVDASKIDGVTNPVVSYVKFDDPSTLNIGLAFVPPGHVYVATDDGQVQALSLDTATGKLAKDDARNLPLPASVDDVGHPASYYVQGVAVSPDGKRLVVTSVFDSRLLVFDVDEASSTRGKNLGALDLGVTQTFGAWFDPNDTTGHFVYVSVLGNPSVLEVDVSNAAAPAVKQTFATDKGPQGIAFLDGRWMAVANDFGDTIAVVDRTSGVVTSLPVDLGDGLHGAEPSTLAFDPTAKRLYATLAGANAIAAWDVDVSATPPKLTPAGRLPTSWWPTDVVAMADGSLVVTDMKGHGNGPVDVHLPPDSGDGMAGAGGGIQRIPKPSAADLAAGDQAVTANDDVAALSGMPAVQCPPGADDFPVPATNTAGPSRAIQHVIVIVRENKAFDSVLGDLPGANGDAALLAKSTPADADKLWLNLRTLARTFAISDNYYTDAELSVQGHVWTTYGRTSDFTERTWIVAGYSRSAEKSQVPLAGIATFGQPVEGSLFDWLGRNHVPYDILGEGVGAPAIVAGAPRALDLHYPGGFIQSISYPDIDKACYVAARIRVRCDLGAVTYMTLPNDHCAGVSPQTPSPETMIATNDEATGMVIDAISHGPWWASSLVIVTEDDPQQGADHVDHHRTPILFASPWIKRGYVSKTHADVASIAKLIAHIEGISYPNTLVAHAPLPVDLFTSTPDFSPYTYAPRAWPLSCGVDATLAEQRATERWDFSDVDDQPGLDQMVTSYLRRTSASRPAR